MIDPWCNGSTADFGSVSQGSNPCGSTRRLLLAVSFPLLTCGVMVAQQTLDLLVGVRIPAGQFFNFTNIYKTLSNSTFDGVFLWSVFIGFCQTLSNFTVLFWYRVFLYTKKSLKDAKGNR